MRLKTFLIGSQFLAVALPICLLGVVNFYYMFHNVQKDVFYKNEMIAHATANHVSELLQDPVRLMQQIRAVYQNGNDIDRQRLDAMVSQIIEQEPFFESVEIVNAQGRIVRVIPENRDLVDIDHSRQEFYLQMKQGLPVYWSNSFVSTATGRPTVRLAMPMQGGILVGNLDLQRISELAVVFSDSYGKDISIAVTDATGVIIAHSDQERVWQREWSLDLLKIYRREVADPEGYKLISGGKEYLVSEEPISAMGWHVIVYQSASAAFSILHRMELFFVITALLVLGGGIAFSWRRISDAVKAFSRLNQRFMEVAAGNYSSKAEREKFTELNEMADHVNQMVVSIRERDKQLQEMACQDPLTGLGNRNCFLQWLQETAAGGAPFAIVFLDLDNFKMINDTHGHWRGDEVLQAVATRLQEVATSETLLARIGGDEFVFLVKNWQAQSGRKWVEELQATMAQPVQVAQYDFYTEASIGIAVFPDDSRDADELLQFADLAMYQVKNSGKNGYRFYNSEMHDMIKRKNAVVEALRSAEVFSEFAVYYQPLLTPDGQQLRGFEALLRWNSKRLGPVSPAEFIPIAEEAGIIPEIGRWVLREACAKQAFLCKETNWKGVMGINVSALQLKTADFLSDIAGTLAAYGVAPQDMVLEITESAVIDSVEETVGILRHLKQLGLQIALDDFGTGYSSLSYLHDLPIDTLKIDRAFVADVMENSKSKAMLLGIVLLAKQLGLQVIAEGIETKEQSELAAALGCDYCQGYYYEKPMPEQQVAAYCTRYRK